MGALSTLMADELLVAGVVHAFADHLLPNHETAAERAVTAAVRCLLSGASVSEPAARVAAWSRARLGTRPCAASRLTSPRWVRCRHRPSAPPW